MKTDLKKIIMEDSKYYNTFSRKERKKMYITKDHFYEIHKYMKYLRCEEYYRNKTKNGKIKLFNKFLEILYAKRKNKLGNILGFYIKPESLGIGTVIYHHGCVIINGGAKLGENCKLHGNNCIGNNGNSLEAPQIGKNVDIGFGASIIGDVVIADNVKIGAGAVVTKSCYTKGATLVGIPAKMIVPNANIK